MPRLRYADEPVPGNRRRLARRLSSPPRRSRPWVGEDRLRRGSVALAAKTKQFFELIDQDQDRSPLGVLLAAIGADQAEWAAPQLCERKVDVHLMSA